jgi:uncharacterized protein YcbX
MIRVARIGVTPLKGTRLAHPDAVELTPLGIPGNRRHHLVDGRGRLFSCSDHGPLMQVGARYDEQSGVLALDLPDGTTVAAGPADLGAPHVTDFYGRPVPGRFVEGPVSDAVSRFVGRPLQLVRADVDGDGPDEHRLSLVSLASVADLGSRNGRPGLDPGRFRMNLELDGCSPYEEDGWAGMPVRVGTAVIRVLGQVPRCVATTRDPATGAKDFDTLKAIAAYRPPMTDPRGIPFGVYAEVEVPGRVALGDPVEPLATP